MKRLFYNLAAMILVLALSSSELFAAATAGMLRSNGGVSVNGAPVNPVTTVFSGDRIETAPNAVGSFSVGGSSVLLNENSSLLFAGQSMDFQCGGGTIQTSQGMAARFGHTTVKPAKDAARYRVQQSGAALQITAMEGDLSLTDGAREFNLAAGKSANVAYNGCMTQLAKADSQNLISKADTAASSPNSPPIALPTSPANSAVIHGLITGGSAVSAVAVTGIILINQNPASPSKP